jgi:hypothetical protein
VDLDTLAPGGQRTLCLNAEEVCLRRLREIDRQADPGDLPLHRLLRDVESAMLAQLHALAHLGEAESPATADPAPYFPSVRERLGEGPLSRDGALYHLENLKEETARFFQRMALAAMDDEARAIYTHIALDEFGHVARLRTVLL